MISQPHTWKLEQKLTLELVFKEDKSSENVNVLKASSMSVVPPCDLSDLCRYSDSCGLFWRLSLQLKAAEIVN